ncbi:MAG: hypothetical protein GXO43_04275 [Crenarchaeota archaeon]|nr:hypothetical protein [Thermoproteota archaeon]
MVELLPIYTHHKEPASIYKFKGKYILAYGNIVVIGRTIREVLGEFYRGSKILSIFPDRDGNLHVKYEQPFYDVDDTLIDFELEEDIWIRKY